MTEKRFITLESGIDYGVKDTLTGDYVFDIDITELLNELNNENEELRKELNIASKLLDGLTIPELLDLVHAYEKENVELKDQLKNLRRLVNESYMEGSE